MPPSPPGYTAIIRSVRPHCPLHLVVQFLKVINKTHILLHSYFSLVYKWIMCIYFNAKLLNASPPYLPNTNPHPANRGQSARIGLVRQPRPLSATELGTDDTLKWAVMKSSVLSEISPSSPALGLVANGLDNLAGPSKRPRR